MINIESRHRKILESILGKYDYSFFLFGSRITAKAKKFSDIDLLYFEDIPNEIILKLSEEFEESDLPYLVDLVDYNKCDDDFKKIIGHNYVCLQPSTKLSLIEQNHYGHFQCLPKAQGIEILEIEGVSVINCGLGSSMFNIVFGVPWQNTPSGKVISDVKNVLAGQPFAWWIPPSKIWPDFSKSLLEAGLIIENTENAMICDLNKIVLSEQKTDLQIKEVQDNKSLQDFISIIEPYDNAAKLVGDDHLKLSEKLFIGYASNKPATIAILFISGESSGIFSLITAEQEQNKGYGTDMMLFLMKTAKENNCSSVTLSASSDSATRIYERLGFKKIGEFECFEYKGAI